MKEKNRDYTETNLLSALQSGDQEAFRYLVEKFGSKVRRTCMGFVHSESDADDLAQEVFVEVFLSSSKFRGESSISTWVYRIAVNKSLNFLRSAGRRKLRTLFETLTGEEKEYVKEPESGREDLPDERLQQKERSKIIGEAMGKLPENQRTAFVLSKYDDLSYHEIAGIMNISLSSVESLLFRARQNLRKLLSDYYKNNME